MIVSLGVALFHNPKVFAGFYFQAGMTKPEEFFGKSDIPTGTVWLTNLDRWAVTGFGLSGNAHFQEDGFLRCSMKGLMKDADVDITDSAERAARYLGELADAVLFHFHAHTGYEGRLNKPLSQLVALALDLGAKNISASSSIDYACTDSKQTYQKCSHDVKMFGGKWYGVRFPRAEYAQDMLSVPVPAGKWSLCNEPWIWIRENIDTVPVLCKIKVEKMPSDQIANLFAFGFSAKAGDTREWATSHEVLFLKEVLGCSVTISQTLIAERFSPSPISLAWHHENSLSVAAGLYAENAWKSLTVKDTAHASWVSSMDRIACGKMALMLDEGGFRVDGFGTGTVQVILKSGEYEDLLQLCLVHGFVPPLTFLRHMEIEG